MIFIGLVLGLGAPRFLHGLGFATGGGGDAICFAATFATMRACAVLLLVLCLFGGGVALWVAWLLGVGVYSTLVVGDERELVPGMLLGVGERGLLGLVQLCALSSRGVVIGEGGTVGSSSSLAGLASWGRGHSQS